MADVFQTQVEQLEERVGDGKSLRWLLILRKEFFSDSMTTQQIHFCGDIHFTFNQDLDDPKLLFFRSHLLGTAFLGNLECLIFLRCEINLAK